MILFRYRALDSKGHYQTGDWFGASSKELYSYLRKQNLSLLSSKVIETKSWRCFSVKTETLIDFCIHLEQLDKVKMPLTDSIILVANSMNNRSFRAILYNLYYSITNGLLLSEACSRHPKIFDSIFVQSISMAEKTGTLGQACNQLQNHLSWKKEQQTKIKQTL